MSSGEVFLLVIGILLIIMLFIVFIYYFSIKKKNTVEQPKYDMLKDDEKLP